jgi:CDP-glucose 4,6-dehydratase
MNRARRNGARAPFTSSFEGRNVLVTGHTGFKGSWLSLWLHELGANVYGYALDPPTQPSNFDLSDVGALLTRDYRADVRDRDTLLEALEESAPELILHLAARTVVREGFVDPFETFSTNVMGTVALLDAVRTRRRGCAVLVISSDKCYANDDAGRAFVEDDQLGGDDPYSASKGAVELVTQAYRRSFFSPRHLDQHGVALATTRAGNVIGGGDWTPDGLVADVMRALRRGARVPIRCPNAVRPWQHVLEPLAGYLMLARRLLEPDAARFCGPWNFGPDDANCESVARVVERLVTGWGSGGWQACGNADDPPEASVVRLSSARASHELGWHGRWTIAEAVDRTVRWYRHFESDPAAARDACLADIGAYTRALESSPLSTAVAPAPA